MKKINKSIAGFLKNAKLVTPLNDFILEGAKLNSNFINNIEIGF